MSNNRSRFAVLAAVVILAGLGPVSTEARAASPPKVNLSRSPSAPLAPMSRDEFATESMTGSYSLYSPPRTGNVGPKPLLVVLQGCEPDGRASQAALLVNELGLRENLFVLYPEAEPGESGETCWSEPSSLEISAQETEEAFQLRRRAWLVSLIASVTAAVGADSERVLLIGASGAVRTAANMIDCHPEIFHGAALSVSLKEQDRSAGTSASQASCGPGEEVAEGRETSPARPPVFAFKGDLRDAAKTVDIGKQIKGKKGKGKRSKKRARARRTVPATVDLIWQSFLEN